MVRRIVVSLALACGIAGAEPLGLEWAAVDGAQRYEVQVAALAPSPVWFPVQVVPATVCGGAEGASCRKLIEVPVEAGDPFLGRIRAVRDEPASVSAWTIAVLPRRVGPSPIYFRRAPMT